MENKHETRKERRTVVESEGGLGGGATVARGQGQGQVLAGWAHARRIDGGGVDGSLLHSIPLCVLRLD